MNILPILNLLEKLEQAAESLYRGFSDIFVDDMDAAFLFYRLSVEENGHASLFRYISRLVSKSQLDGLEIDLDRAQLEKALEEINHFQTRAKLSLGHAVQFAIEVENQIFEYHSQQAVMAALPTIGPLIQSLGRQDQSHMLQLVDFARERGFLFTSSAE
jgi:rubrerythrin